MIYLWMFLALCIVCVSGYIGQVLNVVSAVSSFFGMVILAALIYYFTMWLTGGNELVTGIFMFLAPAVFSKSYRVSISLQRLLSVRTTFVTSVMMGSASSSGTLAKKWLAIGP